MARKRNSNGTRTPKPRSPSGKRTTSALDLVREGVRRFILKNASMKDFQKAIRTAARMGELSPNPLTGAAFRGIVKEALKERKRNNGRRTAVPSKKRKDAGL